MKMGAQSIVSKVRSCSDRACELTEGLLCIIGSAMALLISVQVFSRYVLNHSLFWSEEVGRICLVWITFLGASATYKRHGHVGIDFFVRRFPARLERVSRFLVILASFVLFGILVYYGSSFALFVSSQKTTALAMPVTVPYLVIPLSGVLFLIHGLSHFLELLHPIDRAA